VKAFKQLASEIAYLRGALRTLNRVKPIKSQPHVTISERMEGVCARFADRPALLYEGEVIRFRDFDERVNRYARWARAQGVVKGDTVALLMPNCPDYLAIWLGVARAGGATALLNTGQAGHALAYSVSIVEPKLVIVAASLLGTYREALLQIEKPPLLFVHGQADDPAPRVDEAMKGHSAAPLLPAERVRLSLDDRCVYVYTSGTTGLPKAANINHYRVNAMALGFSAVMNVRPSDRLYNCLPMYHSNGGILSTFGVLIQGGSVVIRDKLSVREFWSDIVQYRCTLFFYIGEVCRYLLSAPPSPYDQNHSVRLICGNGLRPDIWKAFSQRFGIRHIREFYGATEGNIALFNFDSKPGAIGRIPKWAEKRFVVNVVRYDVENEKPMRDERGHCIPCAPDEIGEIIGEIIDDPMAPANRFEGYADRSSNESKVLRSVFREGDAWFRSGDLVTRDADGYFYFVDRVGDTFRWKGENISTNEVAEAINSVSGVVASAVYGIGIKGHDGKAGMAALLLSDHEPFDLDTLARHLTHHLPPHARPVFLRLQRAMDMTGTFKIRKVDLMREGLSPSRPEEPIYWFHQEQARYLPWDEATRLAVDEGRIRL
jgi:fatty-acyl-CoA synthase